MKFICEWLLPQAFKSHISYLVLIFLTLSLQVFASLLYGEACSIEQDVSFNSPNDWCLYHGRSLFGIRFSPSQARVPMMIDNWKCHFLYLLSLFRTGKISGVHDADCHQSKYLTETQVSLPLCSEVYALVQHMSLRPSCSSILKTLLSLSFYLHL